MTVCLCELLKSKISNLIAGDKIKLNHFLKLRSNLKI